MYNYIGDTMQQKITLSIDEGLYRKIHFLVPKRHMSKFVEECLKEKLEKIKTEDPVEKGFKLMGKDTLREKEALEWSEAGISENI